MGGYADELEHGLQLIVSQPCSSVPCSYPQEQSGAFGVGQIQSQFCPLIKYEGHASTQLPLQIS